MLNKEVYMTIKNWPVLERPREKLLAFGVAALSDAELLAIVFGQGTRDCNAVELARRALTASGGLGALVALDRRKFTAQCGLGDAKYVALRAGIEIAKRCLRDDLVRGGPITNARAAKSFLTAELGALSREAFCGLFLDTRHRVITFETLSLGTIDSATVHPREVVKKVLEVNAAAVIFAHNHPSGIAEPSDADRNLTKTLVAALNLIDVRVLDHLIVTREDVVSFADRGLLA